jgi:peptidoglycan/xylan/chitin deacetylase (PgdA/CDA1 family)
MVRRTHPTLIQATLAEEDCRTEIAGSKKVLDELTGKSVRSFSFPYGHEHDVTDIALNAVRQSGHEATFLVHARTNVRRPAKDLWYRVSLVDQKTKTLWKLLHVLPALRRLKFSLLGR